MKKSIILAAIGLTAILAGCTKLSNLANISVDIPYNTQVTVPQVSGYTTGITLPAGGADLPSVTVAVATNSQTYMSQYGTAANMVQNVYMKSLGIQILSPASQNFDFLDNIQIYMSAAALPEVLVASQSNIPKGSTTLNLTTNTDVNLKSYFVKDTIYLRMTAHVNATPVAGETLNINTVLHLVANPLK